MKSGESVNEIKKELYLVYLIYVFIILYIYVLLYVYIHLLLYIYICDWRFCV